MSPKLQYSLEEARREVERNGSAISATEQRIVSIAGFAGFIFPLLGGFAGTEILKARNPQDPLAEPRALTELLGIDLIIAAYLAALVFLGFAIFLALKTLGEGRYRVPGFGSEGISDLFGLESRVRAEEGPGEEPGAQSLDEIEFLDALATAYTVLLEEMVVRLGILLRALGYVGRFFGVGLGFTLLTVAILVLQP